MVLFQFHKMSHFSEKRPGHYREDHIHTYIFICKSSHHFFRKDLQMVSSFASHKRSNILLIISLNDLRNIR